MTDVCEALFAVEIGTVAADRLPTLWQDLPSRDEPQSGVAKPRGTAGSSLRGVTILGGRHVYGNEPNTGCDRC